MILWYIALLGLCARGLTNGRKTIIWLELFLLYMHRNNYATILESCYRILQHVSSNVFGHIQFLQWQTGITTWTVFVLFHEFRHPEIKFWFQTLSAINKLNKLFFLFQKNSYELLFGGVTFVQKQNIIYNISLTRGLTKLFHQKRIISLVVKAPINILW